MCANFRIFGRLFHQEHAAKIGDNFQLTKFYRNYFQPMCKILPRIKQLALNEGITIGALERIIGASKGVLSRAIANGTDIQTKWLEAIVENYPQYSAQWLLTGTGDMLQSNQLRKEPALQDTTSQPTNNEANNDMWSYIREKDKEIGRLNQEIGRYKARIEELERAARVHASPQHVHTSEAVPI